MASSSPQAPAEAGSSDAPESREADQTPTAAAPETASNAIVETPDVVPAVDLVAPVTNSEIARAVVENHEAAEPVTSVIPLASPTQASDVPENTGPIWTPLPSTPTTPSTENLSYYRPRTEPPSTRRGIPATAILGLAIALLIGVFVVYDLMNNQSRVASTESSNPITGTSRGVAAAPSPTPRPSPAVVMLSTSPSPSDTATTEGNRASASSGNSNDQYASVDTSGSDVAGYSAEDPSVGVGTGGSDEGPTSSPIGETPVIDQTPVEPSPQPGNPPAPVWVPPSPTPSPSTSPAPSTTPSPSPTPVSPPPSPTPDPGSSHGGNHTPDPGVVPSPPPVVATTHLLAPVPPDYNPPMPIVSGSSDLAPSPGSGKLITPSTKAGDVLLSQLPDHPEPDIPVVSSTGG